MYFFLSGVISMLTITGGCNIIDTAKDFPQLDFTVPNDTTFWVWDDIMEQRYWKGLNEWKRKPLKVFVVPFSHVDAFWVNTFDEYYRTKTSHILDNLVNVMPLLPEMNFVWSDIAFLAYWWERASDTARTTLKDLVSCGRLEIVTGGWVMPDEATTSLYALFTQLIEGHEWVYDNLQVLPETAWAIDPFGVSSTMPYLLSASGVKGGLLIQRIHYAWQRLLGHLGHSEMIWRQSWDANSTNEMKLRVQHSCTYVITDTCGPATPLCQYYDFAQQSHVVQYKDIRKKTEILLGQYGRLGSLSRHNYLLVPLGGDFRFSNFSEWTRQYTNYKAIMDYVNHNSDLYNARIEFSTLKEFFSQVGVVDLKVEGDFFPYSDLSSKCSSGKCKMIASYWTGYFTTRPRLKVLSSSVGAKLRAVEILFTLGALSWCREGVALETSGRSWINDAQRKLIWARRAWALFQHHDGITGTSTVRVMKQQAKRLKRAGKYLKEILEGVIMRYLYSINATENFAHTPRTSRTVQGKQTNGKHAKIVIYNPLELARNDLLAIIIPPNICRVMISINGQPIPHQMVTKGTETLVYYKTTVPPLSLKMLQLVEYEGDSRFTVKNQQRTKDEYFMMSNNIVTLFFEQGNLVALKSRDYESDITIRIGMYDIYPGYSGAYLFKPYPKVEYFEPSRDAEAIMGAVYKELRVPFDCCTVTIRILSEDENPVFRVNLEYLLQVDDKELFLEISTGMKSVKWVTDMNDFELKERIQVETEGLQANIYPMTSISYVESDEERLVVISDHSHGVANPRQGVLQVMLDRRTSMDDGKGMGEAIRDNDRTISEFLVVLYRFNNLAVDIQGLSRRFSDPSLALTVRLDNRQEENQYSIQRSQVKDQCFPKEYIVPREWDIHRSLIRGTLHRSSRGTNDSPQEFEDYCETFFLLQGCIAEGIRILTLRTRQLSGESPGWALLVLHNTSNTTVSPFPGETSFPYLELCSIVETTLTGIEEIEQYAVLSDIVMLPHTLKSVKLHFKTSMKERKSQ